MSREKVRRFSKFEIAYHAIQGIIYLTLFLTGTIQLLQRFPEIEIIESALLIQVHIVSGILHAIAVAHTVARGDIQRLVGRSVEVHRVAAITRRATARPPSGSAWRSHR